MNPSKPADDANKCARHFKRAKRPASRFRINGYPLLGILLVILLAMLAYGSLFFLLID